MGETQEVIDITYKVYSTEQEVMDLFSNVPSLIACDFEAANKFTEEQKERMKSRLAKAPTQYKKTLEQRIKATGLSHPSLVHITHFQFSSNDHEAHVVVCTNDRIRRLVYDFLVTTEVEQVWHNAGFDFKHIYHNTGKFPKHYQDTQLLARTLLNDADEMKSRTGLKGLMGYAFNPKWKELADDFNNTDPFDPDFLEYCGIDSCATFKLWIDINAHLGTTIEENVNEVTA